MKAGMLHARPAPDECDAMAPLDHGGDPIARCDADAPRGVSGTTDASGDCGVTRECGGDTVEGTQPKRERAHVNDHATVDPAHIFNTTRDLVMSLRSGTCPACNKPKTAMKTFCYPCYRRLPRAKQDALYQLVGEGYEQAFADAMQHLRRNA